MPPNPRMDGRSRGAPTRKRTGQSNGYPRRTNTKGFLYPTEPQSHRRSHSASPVSSTSERPKLTQDKHLRPGCPGRSCEQDTRAPEKNKRPSTEVGRHRLWGVGIEPAPVSFNPWNGILRRAVLFHWKRTGDGADCAGLFHCRLWCWECSHHAKRDDYTAEH
jgi:hypothetical protein